jgi:hypothetical protein
MTLAVQLSRSKQLTGPCVTTSMQITGWPSGIGCFLACGLRCKSEQTYQCVISPAKLRTNVVYGGFDRSSGRVVYVGRASSTGSPAEVVAARVRKGHLLKGNPNVEARPLMTLPSKNAAKGTEGALHDYFRSRSGSTWLNFPLSPPLGKSSGRIGKIFSAISRLLQSSNGKPGVLFNRPPGC